MKGIVKWFNNKRGYGFITTDEGKDVFVHFSGIKSDRKYRMLSEGQKVEFDVVKGEKGDQAANVVAKTPLQKPERKEEEVKPEPKEKA